MLMAIANWSLQDTTGGFLGLFSVGAMVALWAVYFESGHHELERNKIIQKLLLLGWAN